LTNWGSVSFSKRTLAVWSQI